MFGAYVQKLEEARDQLVYNKKLFDQVRRLLAKHSQLEWLQGKQTRLADTERLKLKQLSSCQQANGSQWEQLYASLAKAGNVS